MLYELEKAKLLIENALNLNAAFPLAPMAQSLLFYAEGKEEAVALDLLKQIDKYYLMHGNDSNTNERLVIYFYAVNHFIHLKHYDLAQAYIDKALRLESNYLPIFNLVSQLKRLSRDYTGKHQTVSKQEVEHLKTVPSDIQVKSKLPINNVSAVIPEIKSITNLETANPQEAVTFNEDELQSTTAKQIMRLLLSSNKTERAQGQQLWKLSPVRQRERVLELLAKDHKNLKNAQLLSILNILADSAFTKLDLTIFAKVLLDGYLEKIVKKSPELISLDLSNCSKLTEKAWLVIGSYYLNIKEISICHNKNIKNLVKPDKFPEALPEFPVEVLGNSFIRNTTLTST